MATITIPFSGEYNTRIAQSNDVSGTSGVVGIGIVGLMIVGKVTQATDKDERYVNCMLINQGAEKKIIKRPGLGTLNTPAAGNIGSAIIVWSGNSQKLMTAFGAVNSTIYDSTTSKGAITGKAISITETVLAGTPTLAIASNDNTAWYHDTTVPTKITDVDFPGNVAGQVITGGFAHLDGYPFIMTTSGRIYNGDINSITAWTANSYVTANAYPDKGVGVVTFRDDQLLAFGTLSIQKYRNDPLSGTGSPLRRIPGSIQVGAISWDAIGQISDVIFFVGSSPQGGCTVYQYDGTLNRISTPEIDYQLLLAGPTNISLTTLRVYGRALVLVKANATTYVYVMEDKRWHEWSTTTPLWYKMAGLSTGSQIITYSVSNISTSGKVYVINPASLVFNDDGTTFTASAQSSEINTEDWVTIDELKLIADREPTTSSLTVSTSDDDYVTWSVQGAIDLNNANHTMHNLGSHKRCSFKLTNSANTQMGIKKAILGVS
jgi:hypothetical protein